MFTNENNLIAKQPRKSLLCEYFDRFTSYCQKEGEQADERK